LKKVDLIMAQLSPTSARKAESALQNIQRHCQKVFAPGHANRVAAHKRLFKCAVELKKWEKAVEHGEERLKWLTRVFCPNAKGQRGEMVVAHALLDLGDAILHTKGGAARGEEMMEQGLKMLRMCLGADHPVCQAIEAKRAIQHQNKSAGLPRAPKRQRC